MAAAGSDYRSFVRSNGRAFRAAGSASGVFSFRTVGAGKRIGNNRAFSPELSARAAEPFLRSESGKIARRTKFLAIGGFRRCAGEGAFPHVRPSGGNGDPPEKRSEKVGRSFRFPLRSFDPACSSFHRRPEYDGAATGLIFANVT